SAVMLRVGNNANGYGVRGCGGDGGNTEVLSHTYLGFAKTLKQKDDHEKAKTQFQNALKCYMKLGNKVKIKEIMDDLAGLEKKA
ncbi:MAG: hypothetical protein KJ886_00230, partial [Candidatus Thermoplasmatota archaeon]|nr:hypothetical protein [Candidatus Thermoplasmatota archaeon]